MSDLPRRKIKYAGPLWDGAEQTAAVTSLISGGWIPSGERVRDFERAFSLRFGHKASLMVNSGSSANLVMLAALKAHLGWPDGSEVIVSPVGFPTTIAPIVQNGLTPRFVDMEWDSLNFDLDLVRANVGKRTIAIFLSPVLGNPPDINKLTSLGVPIILDGCDSLGSTWEGKPLSDYAVASSCSFYPAHHITTGEGGMVSSSDPELIRIARQFAWWGRDCYCVGAANDLPKGTCGKRFSDWLDDGTVCDHKYVFTRMGWNLKPLDLQGAIGLEQLKKFDLIHEKRREHKVLIGRWLEGLGLRVPQELPGAETSWFGVPAVCPSAEVKQALVRHFEANGIQTRNYFAGNILKHPGYRHLGRAEDFPNAQEVLSRVFFLGCHPGYDAEDLRYIEQVTSEFRI
jgi:CDP-6-deoxy-D-xylo-4-hexulose-3-dehydrase